MHLTVDNQTLMACYEKKNLIFIFIEPVRSRPLPLGVMSTAVPCKIRITSELTRLFYRDCLVTLRHSASVFHLAPAEPHLAPAEPPTSFFKLLKILFNIFLFDDFVLLFILMIWNLRLDS